MGRCPIYLDVDNFDVLANSMGLSLTDGGVSALGEIAEYLAMQILNNVKQGNSLSNIGFEEIIRSAEACGIHLELDRQQKKVLSANYSS